MLDTRLIFAAAGVLALAFTFNCSDDSPAETTDPTTDATTGSTGGMGGMGGSGATGGMTGSGGGEPCMEAMDCSSNNCVDGMCAPCELCTCLPNDGPDVEMESVAQNAPASAGGVVRDGWYHLTKVTAYTGSGGQTGMTGRIFKQAIYFFGPDVETVIVDNFATPAGEKLIAMGYQPGDNGAIDFTVVCPTTDTPYIPYTGYEFIDGDPAKLILTAPGGNADVVFEYDLIKAAGADDGTAGDP